MNNFYEFGIDLGTTNSCISSYIDGKLITYLNNDGKETTPSVVYIDAKGNKRIGVRALSQFGNLSGGKENDVKMEFKRQMGTKQMFKFEQANIEVSPIELSAEVLMSLKLDALRMHRVQNKKSIDSVVITVPAAFDNVQCENTIKAGKLAGFKNIELVQEPIAAAIAYGVEPNSKDKYWMVFDFGGGTTDVAIISTYNNRLQVIGHAGDNFLGGKDIDKRICDAFFKPMIRNSGLYIEHDTRILRSKAEKIKIALTDLDEVYIDVESLIDNNMDDFINTYETENSVKISKLEFEKSIQDIVDNAINLCHRALNQSKLKPSNIDEILLVGGTTLIPAVYTNIKSEFNIKMRNDNPLTVVSRGAAIYGSGVKVENIDEEVEQGDFNIKLEYEPVTSKSKYSILGKITSNTNCQPLSVRFERNDWSSEWINISKNGIFEADLLLYENSISNFDINVLDDNKNEHKLNQTVKIRHDDNSLIVSAPPLPHSICIELLLNDEEKTVLDPIIKSGTSLPSKASRTYKVTNAVTPGTNEELNIFLWEGDNLELPKANKKIKVIQIKGKDISDKIYKGEDIEITLEMDKSRSSILEAYIPSSDQTIRHEFIYKANYEDIYSTLNRISEELTNYEEFFDENENNINFYDDLNLVERISKASEVCDSLIYKFEVDEVVDTLIDDAQNFINQYLKLCIEIENEVNELNKSNKIEKYEERVSVIRDIIKENGTRNDILKFEELEESYEAMNDSENIKLLDKILNDMTDLMYSILFKDINYLIYQFDKITQSSSEYKDKTKFRELKNKGIDQANNSDINGLRNTIFGLYEIMDKNALHEVTENIQRVGLKK